MAASPNACSSKPAMTESTSSSETESTSSSTPKADRLDVYLVAGGKYHNIDYARLELLKLMAEQPRLKIQVGADYSDIDAICEADFIVSYTCDVIPTPEQTVRLCDYMREGGKWFALHGTNSILRFL